MFINYSTISNTKGHASSMSVVFSWNVLETALRLLEKSADAFPPLKSTIGGLLACLDQAQVGYGCGFNTLHFP